MPIVEERLAILETKMEAILDRIDAQNERLEELLKTFERAKGVKYILVVLFGAAMFLGAKTSVIASWLFGK